MALVEPFFNFETIILSFYRGFSISGNHLTHTALHQCYSSDCCLSILRAGAGLRFENYTVYVCCQQKFAVQKSGIIIPFSSCLKGIRPPRRQGILLLTDSPPNTNREIN